jgi:hypothetical protein
MTHRDRLSNGAVLLGVILGITAAIAFSHWLTVAQVSIPEKAPAQSASTQKNAQKGEGKTSPAQPPNPRLTKEMQTPAGKEGEGNKYYAKEAGQLSMARATYQAPKPKPAPNAIRAPRAHHQRAPNG